ncbi:MAG: 6-carboxytetrahydropterin synthase [Lachnospiraceae bacterium]|nr:6-carboxytetrahydropterin synthase [Lachnospiraceae bacterium]
MAGMSREENGTEAVYCFHYLLPMTHSGDNVREHMHSHTLEITIFISGRGLENESFSKSEGYAKDALGRFEGQYLNDMPEFHGNATIENIGEVFFAMLSVTMEDRGLVLKRLEIGENPLQQYVISTYI